MNSNDYLNLSGFMTNQKNPTGKNTTSMFDKLFGTLGTIAGSAAGPIGSAAGGLIGQGLGYGVNYLKDYFWGSNNDNYAKVLDPDSKEFLNLLGKTGSAQSQGWAATNPNDIGQRVPLALSEQVRSEMINQAKLANAQYDPRLHQQLITNSLLSGQNVHIQQSMINYGQYLGPYFGDS